ncbi:hypothetical protein A5735_15640 [Mycolicibacter heraklionensis]|nr:hypothetical protein A5735_15640 [Mycolicibacter heraklionensis]
MKDLKQGIHQYAQRSRQLVNDVGAIVLDADHRSAEGTFGSEQWAQSARQVINLVTTAGYDMSDALMAQCGAQSDGDVEFSEYLEAPPSPGSERLLSVAAPFVAEGTSYTIPPQALVLMPGALKPLATRFRLGVRGQAYVSGTYRGRIRFTSLPPATAPDQHLDVIVDL